MLPWETVFQKGHHWDYSFAITEKDRNDSGNWRDGKLIGTKFGIDAASHKGIDIAALTLETAKEIYWQEWQAARVEALPQGLGECYFNACVNCGAGRANKIFSDPARPHTANGFLDGQEDFYKRLAQAHPSKAEYLPGWLNRTADLRRFVAA